jgi:hypothetical protein
VAVLVFVDVVDHRRQRGGLARAGGAGDQHDAAGLVGDVLEDLRAVELFRVSTLDGMTRNTAAAPRFWLKALTRKRARLGISNEKSVSRNSSYCLRCSRS